jgi:hypothetical protein
MAVSVVYAIGAVAAAGSYVTARQSAKRQAQAAEETKIAAQFDTEANNQAAMAASARDKTAKEAAANEAAAAAQLNTTPEVTIDNAENSQVRKRRVQAQFGVADGGATTSAGSLRV